MGHRRVRVFTAASALLAVIPALSGCAGSGEGVNLTTFQLTLFGNGNREGTVYSFSGTDIGFIRAGDSSASPEARIGTATVTPQGNGGFSMRGCVSFDLFLPPGAIVVGATLQVEVQQQIFGPSGFGLVQPAGLFPGDPPFLGLGDLLVDHVDLGVALDSPDYAAIALQSGVAVLLPASTPPLTLPQLLQVDVTSSVLDDLAFGRPRSEYRFRFVNPTDGDGFDDWIGFTATFSKGGIPPQLIITYVFPGLGIPYLPAPDPELD